MRMNTNETGADKSNSTMGSAQSSPRTQSGHYRRNIDVEEYLERVHLKDHDQSSEMRQEPAQNGCTNDKARHPNAVANEIPAELFNTLQAELTKREDELATSYAEYNELVDEYNKMKKAAVDHKERANDYRTGYEALKEILNDLIEHQLAPYAEKFSNTPEEWDHDAISTIAKRLFQDAVDAYSLQDQVQVLQKELLSKADKAQAAPDGQLAQDFRVIVSLVKTLSRITRLLEVEGPIGILNGEGMLMGVSHDHWSSRPKKKSLVEAWVWSILIKHVFSTPFAWLGEKCELLSVNWQNLFAKINTVGWPVPSPLCEMWRYTTMEQILSMVDVDVIIKGEPGGKSPEVETSILKCREITMCQIYAGLAELSTTPDARQVRNIVDKSFALAMKMSLQRYRLQVTYPAVGDKFKKEEMAAMPEKDEGGTSEGTVAFVVNPGLTKWGDTHGEHFDQLYAVVPALVQQETISEGQSSVEQTLDQAFEDMSRRGY